MIHSCSYHCHNIECIKVQRDELRDKLFARQWVGLTDEEIREFDVDPVEAKLLIAKLKEKNNG